MVNEGNPIEYMLRNYIPPNMRNNMPVSEDVETQYKLPEYRKFEKLVAWAVKGGSNLFNIYLAVDNKRKWPIVKKVKLNDLDDVIDKISTEDTYTVFQPTMGRLVKTVYKKNSGRWDVLIRQTGQ